MLIPAFRLWLAPLELPFPQTHHQAWFLQDLTQSSSLHQAQANYFRVSFCFSINCLDQLYGSAITFEPSPNSMFLPFLKTPPAPPTLKSPAHTGDTHKICTEGMLYAWRVKSPTRSCVAFPMGAGSSTALQIQACGPHKFGLEGALAVGREVTLET